MKKTIIIGVIGVCLCIAFIFFNVYQNEDKHVIDSAKLQYFNSSEDVKNSSDLIVVVSKIGEEPISYDIGDGHFDNFTLSNVKIEKVIKSMQGKKISNGDIISIIESEWKEKESGVIHNVEHYSKMIQDKKYTLYLGYNPTVDNYYPIGLLYGKVPEDSSEKNFYGDLKNDHIKSVIKQLQTNP